MQARPGIAQEGGLGVQTPVGVIRLPIAKEGLFEVPKIPAVVFGNPRVTNVTSTQNA